MQADECGCGVANNESCPHCDAEPEDGDKDFNALRKQAYLIEQPESHLALADIRYTAYLLRWAADQIEEGCAYCNERGLGYR